MSFADALAAHSAGRDEEARRLYMEILAQDATHLGSLVNLGTLLYNSGFRSAAFTAYRQAVAAHPRDLLARINLANALCTSEAFDEARTHYEQALEIEPRAALAHQGISYVYEALGNPVAAQHHRDLGFRAQPVMYTPYRGSGRATALLMLLSSRGGNVKAERFLDDRRYATTSMFVDYADLDAPVPFHSLVFNAIGDADRCGAALDAAEKLLERTNAPVINPPALVRATGREAIARRLAGIEGLIVPRTQRIARTEFARASLAYPILLRAPGYHTGKHFLRVESAADVDTALLLLPGDDVLAIEPLDARGTDGAVRKYRVMIVDGELYPLHLAIGETWKLHYFTAAMNDRPDRRAEEEHFLRAMPDAIGARAMHALSRIASELALDYGGIDFGLDRDGNVLLFEANAAMMVPMPQSDPQLAYRTEPIERICRAVETMLTQRAALGGAPPHDPTA